MMLDYHWIVPNLAQGSYPGNDHESIWKDFDVLVYMAEEKQPDILVFPGKTVLRGPIDDGALTPSYERRIMRVVPEVVEAVTRRKRVLVTCMAGRNRSGIVVALALVHLYPRWSAREILDTIRSKRHHHTGPAMSNPHFNKRVSEETGV